MTASMPSHVTSGIKLETRQEVSKDGAVYVCCIIVFFIAKEILDEANSFRRTIADIAADIERELDDVCMSVTFFVTLYVTLSIRFLMRTVLLVIYALGQATFRTISIDMTPHG